MARIKIDYGIDLGTTNSAICRMENGEPTIKKTDLQKDIMPSCVSVNKKGTLRVGDTAMNDLRADKVRSTKTQMLSSSNAYVEFKRTMGTDKVYHCSYLNKDFTPEELSSEVLKALKSFVTDENINSVVVTVPAKFTVNQKTATLEAAKLAGFNKCELLQEPIAAAMAYGLTCNQDNGVWMVFDFGGGTFDAALIKVEDGIVQVFDTEGDNYLGGKNLDYAIVDEIIIPYLKENYDIDEILNTPEKKSVLRDAMKTYAEPTKNQLSFKESEDILTDIGELGSDDFGEEMEIDMTIHQSEVFDVMRPYFQKAIDICKKLIARNGLQGGNLDKIILVGGPTHSPLVREMLADQITSKVDSSIDPMTAVAKGAALYASTIDNIIDDADIDCGTVRLDINYESTSVEEIEYVTVVLDNKGDNSYKGDKVYVEFVSADKTWSSGKVEVDTNGNVIEAYLKQHKANQFNIVAYDEYGNKLPCFPEQITIIQGTKVGAAVLPYNISIGIFDLKKNEEFCHSIGGLEKNKPLPAKGVAKNLKTSSSLMSGSYSDKVVIPVYQSETVGKNVQSKYFEHVTDIEILGSEVNTSIPEGTEVDVTIRVDSNEQMELEISFQGYDITITKEYKKKKQKSDTKQEVRDNFKEADNLIEQLKKEGVDTSEVDSKLDEVKAESENNDEGKMILQHQKEVIREIEQLQSDSEFDRILKKVDSEFKMLEEDQNKYGDNESQKEIDKLKQLKQEVIRKQDVALLKEVLDLAHSLDFKIARIEYYIIWLLNWDKKFDEFSWTDRIRARELINDAISKASNHATADEISPFINQIFDLLPELEHSSGAMGRLVQS